MTVSLQKGSYHRRQKMKSFGNHEEYLARIAKSLYYVKLPLINCTSLPVTELAAEIFSKTNKFSLNRLDIEKAAHLSRNACVSPCLLVLALLYLERLKASNPKYLTQVSPTELFLISLLVGSKFLQDDGEGDDLSNTEWAELTSLSVDEINKAEKEFLDAINWEVFVSQEEFWNRLSQLESKVGLKEGCNRGWFTYTELNLLIQLIDLSTIVQCFWNVTTACMLSYTASVLALVGSTLLVNQIPGLGLKPKVPVTEVANVNWTTTSPSNLTENLLMDTNGIEDCSNVSPSVDSTMILNVTEPKLLNLGQIGYKSKSITISDKSLEFDFFQGLSFYLTASDFDAGRLLVDNSNDKNYGLLLTRAFNVWTWSDYIRNYLLKSSVPTVFYSVSSF